MGDSLASRRKSRIASGVECLERSVEFGFHGFEP